jgi:hypothetical protein
VTFLASGWLVVESGHVAESVDRVNQRHVLEPIGGKDQYLLSASDTRSWINQRLSMSAVVNFDENRHGVLVSGQAG